MERKFKLFGLTFVITDEPIVTGITQNIKPPKPLIPNKYATDTETRKRIFLVVLQRELEKKLYENYQRKKEVRFYFPEDCISSGTLQPGLLGMASDYLRGNEESRAIVSERNHDGTITSKVRTKRATDLHATHHDNQESVNEVIFNREKRPGSDFSLTAKRIYKGQQVT